MKGLIYKDIAIFFKCIDRKMILIAVGAIILLMCNTGVYAGLVASVLLAMTIGMQNVMSFASVQTTARYLLATTWRIPRFYRYRKYMRKYC